MSLFGTSRDQSSSPDNSAIAQSRNTLFGEEDPMTRSTPSTLFNDDDLGGSGSRSPWDMPTPRKQRSRADLLKSLLASTEVPDTYIETFDHTVADDGDNGRVTLAGVTRTLAAAKLNADDQTRIASIMGSDGDQVALGRNEFNVLLALIGLAQEGESVSLDGVDERRRNLPKPKLSSPARLNKSQPKLPDLSDLAAKPPQTPVTPTKSKPTSSSRGAANMDIQEDDPWASPDLHKNHNHAAAETPRQGRQGLNGLSGHQDDSLEAPQQPDLHTRTTSTFTTSTQQSASPPAPEPVVGSVPSVAGAPWGYFDGSTNQPGFGDNASRSATSPFGPASNGMGRGSGSGPSVSHTRTISAGRTGSSVEENILVNLLPEKEGMFLFQHHNYEVTSSRRGSKVIRRYSDFVWLLDCLHKRYPFRALPLLPPKRVGMNGNHLSNDNGFIEKRRRGLARYLNAVVRHPILGQEQLVIMFLTVPTELSVWRKQATISVTDEFTDRALPPGLEESLPQSLGDLFDRTRQGVHRSADLYITACNLLDRLVKRTEGVAADHARLALSLQSLIEASADTYATDTNEVPLLNDGLAATSKHLRTTQTLMEDESKAWDAGVLEDLKRQRDALVSLRDMFERRERLDRDSIPQLERRIQSNETKLAGLRSKPDGLVKPGEVEKVVEAIIKDKESIVNQHNRSIFVKECLRDELIYFQQTQYHVSRWNQDWAQERVKYSEMLADNWRRLLDELDGMPLGD
ncbi:sorting nexin-8 [Microdochium nivale]|nr:sorting nexin-8 [Microdochium nivale]